MKPTLQMQSRATWRLLLWVALFDFFPTAQRASPPVVVPALEMQPAVVAFAEANQIPITGIAIPAGHTGEYRNGSVSALIVYSRAGHEVEQWLVCISRRDPQGPKATAGGRKTPIPDGLTLFTVATAGPFGVKDRVPARLEKVDVRLNEALLALGFARYCSLSVRFFSSIPREARTDKVNPGAVPDALRSAAMGVGPTLLTLYDAARDVPPLKTVLGKITDKPSLLSVIGNAGIQADLSIGEDIASVPWNDADAFGIIYRLPFAMSLNGRSALSGTFFVAAPRSSLQMTAGIVGGVVTSASDPQKRLDIRIIATRDPSEVVKP